MTTSATGSRPLRTSPALRRQRAFTLVELLTVVAIMAIVMGVLGYAIGNMGGPAPQVAASQVASGLSLARQLAISKNTETRFIIADLQAADGVGLPQESFRYWTVIMTNKGAASPSENTWVMMKEWEKLPVGVVFLNLAAGGYNTINNAPIGAVVGQPFKPQYNTRLPAAQEWQGFGSYGPFNLVLDANRSEVVTRLRTAPAIGYNGVGEALWCSNSSRGSLLSAASRAIAVRVAAGVVDQSGQLTLKATNNSFYVETDRRGRIRVRSRESYRN